MLEYIYLEISRSFQSSRYSIGFFVVVVVVVRILSIFNTHTEGEGRRFKKKKKKTYSGTYPKECKYYGYIYLDS